MSSLIRHPLTLTIPIAVPLLLVGCGIRRDEAAWPWSQEPTPIAAAVEPESHSLTDFGPVSRTEDKAETNALTSSFPGAPRALLEAAGGIIEQDAQGQPAGVNLSGAEISSELMEALTELGDIQWLDLRGARLSDEHLALLPQLTHLQLLALSDTQITNDGLKSIRGLGTLRFLSLDRTIVSDAGLKHVAGLKNLEGISLQGTLVSEAGVKSIEANIPGCNVIIEFEDDASGESPVGIPAESREPFPGEPTSETRQETSQANPRQFVRTAPRAQRRVSGMGDAQRARQELASLLEQKLLDPEILDALGQHLLAQKNYYQAARAFEAVLKLEPDNLRAHYGLAVARARVGRFDDALPHFAAVVGDATAYYNIGVIAYESRRPKQSERFFQQALEQDAEFDEARHWLAHLRRENAIRPASHSPQPVDESDLVNLLMSEFGRVSPRPPERDREAKIEIVPAMKSGSPDRR